MATTKRDYYEVLGISREASQQEIRSAYRRLARQYHPDLNKNADAEERFKELNECYEVLSDPQRRSMYDRFGHAGVNGQPGFGGFEGGIGEIFEQFFGGFARAGSSRRTGPQPGNDIRTHLSISLEEALTGVASPVKIQRFERCESCNGSGAAPGTTPIRCVQCAGAGEVRQARQSIFGQVVVTDTCPRCRGTGEVIAEPCACCNGQRRKRVTHDLEVEIPAGIDNGMRVRIAGEGDDGLQGGPSGNLYVEVSVKPHDYFRRDGQNITLDLEVNVAQAALGAEVEVPTVIDGLQTLSIPPGSQTGATFRLRNMGAPHVRNRDLRGDQIVTLFVKVPTQLDAEQRALFTQLAGTLGSDKVGTAHRGGFFDRLRDALK